MLVAHQPDTLGNNVVCCENVVQAQMFLVRLDFTWDFASFSLACIVDFLFVVEIYRVNKLKVRAQVLNSSYSIKLSVNSCSEL